MDSMSHPPKLRAPSGHSHSINHKVVKHFASIVGLEEALLSKNASIRFFWSFVLVVSIGATAWFVFESTQEYFKHASATKVEMKSRPKYDYPPFVICPSTWLDVPKALSMGLSLDALVYSLGYARLDTRIEPLNITSAKAGFLEFYHRQKYSNLEDYFEQISIDVHPTSERGNYSRKISQAWCSSCIVDSVVLPKEYFEGKVCYVFQLRPEDGRALKPASRSQKIMFKIEDRSWGLAERNVLWHVFVTARANMALNYYSGSRISIAPYAESTVRLSEQRVLSLNDHNERCLSDADARKGYTSRTCYAKCLETKSMGNEGECQLLYESFSMPGIKSNDPTQFCNMFDSPLVSFWDRREYLDAHSGNKSNSREAFACERDCPPKCDRTLHDLVLWSQIDSDHLSGLAQWGMGDDRKHNLTAVEINIELAALEQGGIFTTVEVSTQSFTRAVGSLGGVLGLFVGATIMTFVQMILFGVKLAMDRRYARAMTVG